MKGVTIVLCVVLTLTVLLSLATAKRGRSNFFQRFKSRPFGYSISCNDTKCCNNVETPSDLTLSSTSSFLYYKYYKYYKEVLDLLEDAVDRNGSQYEFALRYSKDVGYKLHELINLCNSEECAWNVYIGDSQIPLPPEECLNVEVRQGQTVRFSYEQIELPTIGGLLGLQ